jgi:L-fucose mutarotase
MQTTKGDPTPTIWAEYQEIVDKHNGETKMSEIERFAFYDRAKTAYAIIATSEMALYANVILKKGVVTARTAVPESVICKFCNTCGGNNF